MHPDAAPDRFFDVGSTAVNRLSAEHVERQAITFLALRDIAHQRRDRVPGSILSALDAVVQSSGRICGLLFGLPHIRQWCLTLREFLVFNLGAEGVQERLDTHAAELRRLLFSSKIAAHRDDGLYETLVVHPNGSLHLPGTGQMLVYGPDCAGRDVRVGFHDGLLEGGDILINAIGAAELWTTDMLVRRSGSRVYAFPNEDQQEIQRWRQLVEEYTGELAAHWAAFHREIPFLLKGIIAVETPSGETHLSGTFSEVPGAIYLSWADSREVIKEAITHELFHTRLNLLIDHHNFDRTLHEAEMFWAPWRFQVRPCIPFVHGVYAHFGMMLHNHFVSRHCSYSNWRSKLATHLIRLAVAEAQWSTTAAHLGVPSLLLDVTARVFEVARQVFNENLPDLTDEFFVAIAGERGEIRRHGVRLSIPERVESVERYLKQLSGTLVPQ